MSAELAVAASSSMNRLTAAVSLVKAAADAQAKMAELIAQAADNVPVSSSRGVNVNVSA